MKKLKLFMLLCVLFSLTTYAQERNCGTMADLANRMKEDPGLSKRMSDIEIFTQQKVKKIERSSKTIEGDIITIPVVVHVLSSTTAENISQAIIDAQINVLNQDFRRTNSDRDNRWSQAADAQIEFCLARVDPNGNATNGVTRKQTTQKDWRQSANAMKRASSGGVDAWDTSQYLNMWIVPNIKDNSNRDVFGYAQFPGGAAATDGIVMGHQYFGTTGSNAISPFNLGRTTTHEIGHFFNLRHIWGDGGCGVDDFVADTPESDAANTGCEPTHTSCGTVDMVQNFMDYSDDSCMNLFTEGQKNRMRAVLLSGGARSSLALSNKCQPPTQSTCTDGVQNGDETGVDCGGSCTPCSTGDGKCDGVAPFDRTKTYKEGDKIIHNNTLYELKNRRWVNLGTCDSTVTTPTCTDGIKNGSETGVDCGGSCTPCSTGNGKCDGVAAYDRNKAYTAGDKVVHNNTLYERRANGGWTNLGSCDSAKSKGLTSSFTVSPNPLTSNLLTLSSNTIEDVSYTIINTLGQTIKKGTLSGINTVDVGALKVGLYLVQFNSKDQNISAIKRFIKR